MHVNKHGFYKIGNLWHNIANSEAKSVIDSNSFFTSHLFKWYSTYVRSYELIIHANKLAKVSAKERRSILQMLQSLENIDEAEEVMNRLRSFPVSNNSLVAGKGCSTDTGES